MRKHNIIFSAIVVIVVTVAVGASTYEYWEKVYYAALDGLPRTAVQHLDEIIKIARKEKNHSEWLMALTQKIVYESTIQGSNPEEKVGMLKKEIKTAEPNTRVILQTILAQWYCHYYSRNKYRFMKRTATSDMTEDDFTTWDLKKIFHEIDSLYQDLLKQRHVLVTIPAKKFIGFLEGGNTPLEFRPTLYDFVAHEALKFYESGEQAALRPEDAFEVDAQSNAFGPVGSFLLYTPVTTDTQSAILKAIKIYQSLLGFHLGQGNDEAVLDADLLRLRFVKNIAFGENKNTIYKQRLHEHLEKYDHLNLSSMVAFYLAQVWGSEGDLAQAYEIAEQGYHAFPDSRGGKSCKAYMTEITQKTLTLSIEKCVPPQPSKMLVSYKNFSRVYIRIYRGDWDLFMEEYHRRPYSLSMAEVEDLLTKTPYKEWSVDLPVTSDYKMHNREIDMPALAPGFYRICVSWQEDFQNSSMVQHIWCWVSNMTLVARSKPERVGGLVVDIRTGEPLQGVEIREITRKDSGYIYGKKTRTDENGSFEFRVKPPDHTRMLYLRHGDEELFDNTEAHVSSGRTARPYEKTLFFTDRSIYRPGQTIYFKGICIRVDVAGNDYDVIQNRTVDVVFKDVNGKEISRIECRSNEYGSISGHFIAPSDRLTGRMNIDAVSPPGGVGFSVEEYKRPKFTVEIEVPEKEYKLDEQIEITGNALAYTGAPVSNAQVKYIITRGTHYPYWRTWYGSGYSSASQQIAHGTIATDGYGKFTISFPALADPKVPEDACPRFSYAIHADVTSPDGETRSADARVNIGYTTMDIRVSTDAQLVETEEIPLHIAATTLNGKDVSAEITLNVYRLQEPAQPVVPRYWHYLFEDDDQDTARVRFAGNWMTWPKEKLVISRSVSTRADNPKTVGITLNAGLYKVECESQDKYGKPVKAFCPLMVMPDWNKKTFTIKFPSISQVKKQTVEVGDKLDVFWGTGFDRGRCFVEIEHDNVIVTSYWTDADVTQHRFMFPVTEKYRGGFAVHLTHVKENRLNYHRYLIDVPWDTKDLELSFEHFRDRLEPGDKEHIQLSIKGKKKSITPAEILAAMYDFSLDQFHPHSWSVLNVFKRHSSRMSTRFLNGMHRFWSLRSDWNVSYGYPSPAQYLHLPAYTTLNYGYYQYPIMPIQPKGIGKISVQYGDEVSFKGDYGRFSGRIISAETGGPLIGADVIIVGTELGTATDKDGNFSIMFVPEGVHTVKASYISYFPVSIDSVKSVKGKVTFIDIKMEEQLVAMLPLLASAQREKIVVSKTSADRARVNQGIVSMEVTGEMTEDVKLVGDDMVPGEHGPEGESIDTRSIKIRAILDETAFFYPHVRMEKDGTVKIEFTVPEALTKWKFMGFAHGKKLESGSITGFAITQKDLMVQPNPPRFLREGDTVFFTAKVSNMSEQTVEGRVQLDFKDLVTDESMNEILGLQPHVQSFKIQARTTEAFAWRLYVPKGTGPLTYTVVAKSKGLSDGETGGLPVLSSRLYLTESFPLHIRGPATKKFSFARVAEMYDSRALEPFKFTVQMASNPAWYSIQALPYLMEYPYGCSEQIFNQYYANSLARHIALSDPRVEEIFERWRGTDALKSNLEKNEELKSVVMIETPWIRQAESEAQQKRNIGLLFEEKTIQQNLNSAFLKLKNMQKPDGSWPWFPGGRSSQYITLYIVTGFGRLRHLDVECDMSLALSAIDYLDRWIDAVYDSIADKSNNHLSPTIALYLYGRSFYLEEKPIPSYAKVAVEYFLDQGEKYWLSLNSRMSQGYLALAFNRFADNSFADKIMASIKERSVTDEELGMFWREDELSWWWYRAPIETQALMVEAFSEVTNDTAAVEDCKVWLLKQKQTQHWRTTKATADAVYAIILRGMEMLTSTKTVRTELGGKEVTPKEIEVGTGYYEQFYLKDEILPEFSEISIVKEDEGIAWGGAFFQYFEEISAVIPHTTNLSLDKKIFVERQTKQGKVIEPLTGTLAVGDLVTVRIILRVDRDMEYVHMKDMRGTGLEPVDVLSGYRYQDGLRYYQSTKDVATHFFIDYLPKGTYVFEYDLRVQHKGIYQSGIAEIQCMYAPEFNSHSQSHTLVVE